MTQRFREVAFYTKAGQWLEHEIEDRGQATVSDGESKEQGGGQSFLALHSFNVKWRVWENVAEIMLEGFSSLVVSSNIRITCCGAALSGDVNLTHSNDELIIMLASSYAVHSIVIDTSNIQMDVRIISSVSYPVKTDTPIVQCSAISTEDFGVVFSLITEDHRLIAATVQNGAFEEIELQQSSLINTIWNRVRRSVMSGADNRGNAMSTVISPEHPSIYCLTKNLQLQQWAIGTWECVASYNLLTYVTAVQGIVGQAVRFFSYHPNNLLGVLFTDGDQSKIILVTVSGESGSIEECLMVAECLQNEVIAFNVISQLLFILWRDLHGTTELIHVSLTSSEPRFMKAYLKDTSLPLVELENCDDPRDAFTSQIFHSNTLCVQALLQAIYMLDPATQCLSTLSQSHTIEELKRITWSAISNEVKNSVTTEEVTNLEYRELQIAVWQKLYTNLKQYQQELMKPLGLVGGREEFPIALVRKGFVSYIRPCDPLEQQILYPSEPLDNSAAVNQDIVSIMQAIDLLRNYVEGYEEHIYASVLYGEPVNDVIRQVMQTITKRADHTLLKSSFTTYIQNIHLLRDGIAILIHFLNVINQLPQDMAAAVDADATENPFVTMNDVGRAFVCSSVQDVVETKYKLCCSLVIFLEYITQLAEEINRSEELHANIEELSSTCHALLRIYAVVLWTTKLKSSCTSDLEVSTEMLELLKITNSDNMEKMIAPAMEKTSLVPVLASFLAGIGGSKVKALVNPAVDDSDYYGYLNQLILAAVQALWPETMDILFPEYLLASNELTQLQAYCRLLDGYCADSASSRMFLLGQSHLLEREPEKAYRCFVEALHGMFEDPVDTDEMDADRKPPRQLDFCFKVMNLFEEMGCSEQVILMAQHTLQLSNTAQATLYTKIFKHNLELEHYDEAFKSILNNTDQDSKMDCLHQFISTLCDRGRLRTLASYPYKDMTSQQDLRPAVVSILLRKARSVDLTVKNYYDLLYSFHVVNNDLLSAANVMYECCERLSCELTGLAALQKKAKCYLACIHALHCVPTPSAWIAPGKLTECKYSITSTKSPKRTNQGQRKVKSSAPLKILTLPDIEKEYMLVNMALRLAGNGCKQITGSSYLHANEIVALLCNIGMYDEAIEVSTAYKLSLAPMFESLTFRCIRMSREADNDRLSDISEETKLWLTYNRLPSETSYSSSRDHAWKILRHYLEQYEAVSTRQHKVVANKLLANGASLPEWLIASYKHKNVAELLRVYLKYDLIEEAVELAIEFLSALSGKTFDRFGLEGPLSGTMGTSSVCVPYTSLDTLLNLLDEHKSDPYYMQFYTRLNDAVRMYFQDLDAKSSDLEKRLQSVGTLSLGITDMGWS